ncbi:hypothetical protein RM51_08515 [Chryseobacterium taiwanense]|uniref:Uncharacterized protein n=1 Tax=Chryseobacterium taiwanense TaxID=363331 RepID=A0A0B4DGX5_9FLAO|nr:hypothetical protein RM51_08515 [Chryseobacterium taiwanense]
MIDSMIRPLSYFKGFRNIFNLNLNHFTKVGFFSENKIYFYEIVIFFFCFSDECVVFLSVFEEIYYL